MDPLERKLYMNSSGSTGPVPRSHYLPRTREGWVAVALFLLVFALVEPPIVHLLANRIEPWVMGVPFLYAYLLLAYLALIGVLIWAGRRGI